LYNYIRLLDLLFRYSGGYSLTRQQVNCKTGANIGSPVVIQSRSASGKLTTNFDFSNATVGTCWTMKLTLTKTNMVVVQTDVFKIRKR
jgi:hypothetical protein